MAQNFLGRNSRVRCPCSVSHKGRHTDEETSHCNLAVTGEKHPSASRGLREIGVSSTRAIVFICVIYDVSPSPRTAEELINLYCVSETAHGNHCEQPVSRLHVTSRS